MNSKLVVAALVFVSVQSFASERLLRCNPPMGSSLQEIEITREGSQILLNELNMSGSRSKAIEVPAASWAQRDLKWTSPDEGQIHLRQVSEGSQVYWAYESQSYGVQVMGYCQ